MGFFKDSGVRQDTFIHEAAYTEYSRIEESHLLIQHYTPYSLRI